jgi:hypothetical protein
MAEGAGCCKMRPMVRRSALPVCLLLAALTLLAPLAAVADSCTDCLWGAPAKCCPSACCSCCAPGASALTSSALRAVGPARAGLAVAALEDGCLSTRSRDVFHVPKASLV